MQFRDCVTRVVPEFQEDGLREIVFQNFRIIYLVEEGTVAIVTVVHGAVDLPGRAPWRLT